LAIPKSASTALRRCAVTLQKMLAGFTSWMIPWLWAKTARADLPRDGDHPAAIVVGRGGCSRTARSTPSPDTGRRALAAVGEMGVPQPLSRTRAGNARQDVNLGSEMVKT
jgi:hypothetical protein